MKVKFKREGGFAGMTLRREVEQHELPQAARRALDSLQSIGATSQPPATKRRDGFVYTIEFENDHMPIVVAVDEGHVPSELAPLIHFFESST
jgi:hypothetical protein